MNYDCYDCRNNTAPCSRHRPSFDRTTIYCPHCGVAYVYGETHRCRWPAWTACLLCGASYPASAPHSCVTPEPERLTLTGATTDTARAALIALLARIDRAEDLQEARGSVEMERARAVIER